MSTIGSSADYNNILHLQFLHLIRFTMHCLLQRHRHWLIFCLEFIINKYILPKSIRICNCQV
uniref:Uncharacterized protein n=1 Tax=Lotus japonicus TaxID=34305 RepID=I3T8N8_LOTJA|nr:unknown [Lotus japonicus]